MKEKILARLDKLEYVVRQGQKVPMVACIEGDGVHWNGVTYPNEKALDAAAREILGEVWEKPLIIISRCHGQERVMVAPDSTNK